MAANVYASKLTDAATAVASVSSNSNVGLGMAISQPPGLMQALADRAAEGDVSGIKLF